MPPSLIDVAAETLRGEVPLFTRRNLFHAVRRAGKPALTEPMFEAMLKRRLSQGTLSGLLSTRRARLPREWDVSFPEVVLLVDRPAVADLFMTSKGISSPSLTVVCIDGTPSPVVAWLERGFGEGRRAPVLYLHDAATVIYPFTIEPLATLVRHRADIGFVFQDIGLPPLGANARRFHDPTLQGDEPILDLEAIPPGALLRYVAESARLLTGA